jgi:hypothetical protein
MSRSKKKTPGWKDQCTWAKIYANRRLRRILIDLENPENNINLTHKSYKKFSCRWLICDWRCLEHNSPKYSDLSKKERTKGYQEWIK